MFPMFDDLEEPQAPLPSGLITAAKNKRYPTLYALLGKLDKPLGPEYQSASCELLKVGLECSIGAFRAILDHCPPVTELIGYGDLQFYELDSALSFSSPVYSFTLLDKAARDDRPEHLNELLHRGCSPNSRDGHGGSSALLAAFLGRSSRCVRRLVREPELDTTLTPALLSQWARVGLKGSEKLEKCCRAAAPRLLEKENSAKPLLFHGTPIPPQLEVKTALSLFNFPLAEFLCRNKKLSEKEAMAAIELLGKLVSILEPQLTPHSFYWKPRPRNLSRQQLCAMLDALFTAYPQFLRRRLPRMLLLFAALSGKSVSPLLRPWLDRLGGKRIILDSHIGFTNLALTLFFWEERLGARWIPVLEPQRVSTPSFFSNLPLFGSSGPTPLELLLSKCLLRSFSPGKKLTSLSLAVLHLAPIPLLLRQLQPGGLLLMEDPRMLLDYCLPLGNDQGWNTLCSHYTLEFPLTPQRRQAVLTHIKTEVDYAL